MGIKRRWEFCDRSRLAFFLQVRYLNMPVAFEIFEAANVGILVVVQSDKMGHH